MNEYLAILPEISLLVVLVFVLGADRFVAEDNRRQVGMVAAWGALVTLLITVGVWWWYEPFNASLNSDLATSVIWGDMLRMDMVTFVFRVMFLLSLLLTILISLDIEHLQRPEFYGLLVTATIGFNLMAASVDLVMLFVALETASISLYLLAGFSTAEQRSTEAGMKYFVYGAFASAVMLYGMSLLYGLTGELTRVLGVHGINLNVVGETNIYELAQAIAAVPEMPEGMGVYFVVTCVLILAGFAFKISAVPFHFWAPDVYEGAPTPVTAFASTASKAAGFAVLFRVIAAGMFGSYAVPLVVEDGGAAEWWIIILAMCVFTMTIGNFAAIFQTNLKRMLAYSSVAQAGYVLIGLLSMNADGAGAAMYYLLMYVATNIVAFGVVILVSNATGADNLEDFYGLNRRAPFLALMMLLALLSLGGIPPTAGFIGKFFIFKAAVDAGLWWLALIGILNAFIALYYYLTVIKYMYLYDSDAADVAIPVSRAARLGLALGGIIVLYMGTVANQAFVWTTEAASAFFAILN
ncbi:MAG TPA: NADH-quinone oxidoreductase subunit N [Anaerolineae bacterium]|nr:NADH-quinone oxidoreductase subunit N [Anaerolineae bacterium]